MERNAHAMIKNRLTWVTEERAATFDRFVKAKALATGGGFLSNFQR
jgi:hypothetical protein